MTTSSLSYLYTIVAMEIQADPGIGAGPMNVNVARVSTPRFQRGRQCFKWSRVIVAHDSFLPPPRSGAASVVVQGKLYMFGVSDASTHVSLLLSFSQLNRLFFSFSLGIRWRYWTVRRLLLV